MNFKSFRNNLEEELNGYVEVRDNYKSEYASNFSHSASLELGFTIDEEYDVYNLEGYGVFCTNLHAGIKSVEALKKFYDADLKCNPYHKIVDLMNEGYEFVLGPAFPMRNGEVSKYTVGLFCKNYYEMVEKEKQTEENYSI